MSKQYYDQPINASTKWGGDSSTGGLQVKGSRVQEFIKGSLNALGASLRSIADRLEALDGNDGVVQQLNNLIPAKAPAAFDGFVNDVTLKDGFPLSIDGVVFDTSLKCFLGRKDGSYYSDFTGREKYAGSPLAHPYVEKTYICDNGIYVWDGTVLTNAADGTMSALRTALEAGSIIPALARDISSWTERTATVKSTFAEVVRTTAGDESIDSGKPARLLSIVAKSDFAAKSLRTTGFNLLHSAQAVGGGYYFMVPKLTFGTFGTVDENNGVLFTKSDGTNLTPTVRFKPLSEGVPTNVNQGTVCAYTEAEGRRFYTTDGPGYLIVTGIALDRTCAHIAWSRRYDEFVSPEDEDDKGSYINLVPIIAACQESGRLLVAAGNAGVVADAITFGDRQATWVRNVGRVTPEWHTVDNGDGTYTHSATISGMKEGGIAQLDFGGTAIDFPLDVTLNVVSFTDDTSDTDNVDVRYELGAPVTGTVDTNPMLIVEDWGLECLDILNGEAEVTVEYAQGFPDAVAALVTLRSVLEESIGGNEQRISEVEREAAELGARALALPLLAGQPMKLYGGGTPAEELVPDNWIPLSEGGYAWTGLPTAIGQEYIDTENGGKYEAVWDNFTQRTLKWLKV